MPYRILRDTALHAENVSAEAVTYASGTVVDDWQVPNLVRQKLREGDAHYVAILEQLTDAEAFDHRAKKTALEGDRFVDGRWVSPPWPDFIGLNTAAVIQRMKAETDCEKVEQAKAYERGAESSRDEILNYDPQSEPSDQGAATSAKSLRWSESNPGDAAHVAELETRLTSLESRVAAIEQPRQRFVLASPLAGVMGAIDTETANAAEAEEDR